MKQLFPRGKRIRPTDKDLVFHTALASLFPVFLLVVLLFHIRADCRNQLAGSVPLPDSTGCKYPLPVIQHGRGRAGVSYSSSSVLAIPQGRSKAAHPPPKAGKDGVGKQVV